MTNETTRHAVTGLQWHRQSYLVAPTQLPVGYAQHLITDYRHKARERGGTTIEVYALDQT